MALPGLVWAFAVGPIVLLGLPINVVLGNVPDQQILTAAMFGSVMWVSAYIALRDFWAGLAA